MSEITTAANNIYNRLRTAPAFHPANAELFTDWNVQAGDVITVQSDGESYSVPVYSMKLKWTGAPKVSVESTGNPERAPIPEIKRREYAENSANHKETKRASGAAGSALEKTAEINGTLYAAGLRIDPVDGVWMYAKEQGALGQFYGGVQVTAGQVSQVVSAVGADGQVTAASIVASINRETLESNVMIDADHVGIKAGNTLRALAGTIVEDENGNVTIVSGGGLRVRKTDGGVTTEVGVYDNNNLTAGVLVQKINGDATQKAQLGFYDNNTLTAGVLVQKINGDAYQKASLGFFEDGDLTAGFLIQRINGTSEAVIRADKVNLGNYATVSRLSALENDVLFLTTGQTTAQTIGAYNGSFYNSFMYSGNSVSWLYESVVTAIPTNTLRVMDANGGTATIRYLSGTPTTKTIFYLGRVPS